MALFEPTVLRATLGRIDGRPFPAYRDLVGSYRLPGMVLHVDRVQPDPFAPPSRLRVTLPVADAGFADVAPSDRLPLLDFLLRAFAAAAAGIPDLRLPPIGPEVLERSALVWEGEQLELRFGADLPADERRVLGRQAMALLLRAIPEAVAAALRRPALDGRRLRAHLETYADNALLRETLAERGWVAFVADGAVLPRLRGGSEAPLPAARAVAFQAPEPMAATVLLPHAGPVRGMALPRGVTLIVGGGYHGKSTLLSALAAAVYPHVPGDGRERVATVADACAVRVDEGRPVTGVDVASFVQGVPGMPPGPFTSPAASGSTSQAAGIMEALELGCTCLLIDEDSSAANFMARDARMQALVPPAEEPIIPLADRLREMAGDGVSTVLVAGGHGAFLAVADRVVRMRGFRAEDATDRAREVVATTPGARVGEADAAWRRPAARRPLPETFPATLRVRPRGRLALGWDERTVELSALSQLVDEGQTRAIADLLQLIGARYTDGRRSLAAVVAEAFAEVDRAGLAVISPWRGQSPGEYVRPRPFEVAAAINRLPTLAVAGATPQPAAPGIGPRRLGDGPAAGEAAMQVGTGPRAATGGMRGRTRSDQARRVRSANAAVYGRGHSDGRDGGRGPASSGRRFAEGPRGRGVAGAAGPDRRTAAFGHRGDASTGGADVARERGPRNATAGAGRDRPPADSARRDDGVSDSGRRGYSPQGGAAQGRRGYSPQGGAAQGRRGYSSQGGAAQGRRGYSPQGGAAQGRRGYSSQDGAAQGRRGYSPQGGAAQGRRGPAFAPRSGRGGDGADAPRERGSRGPRVRAPGTPGADSRVPPQTARETAPGTPGADSRVPPQTARDAAPGTPGADSRISPQTARETAPGPDASGRAPAAGGRLRGGSAASATGKPPARPAGPAASTQKPTAPGESGRGASDR